MIYCGAQNDPEIEPLRSILNTHLNVAHTDMLTKSDATPIEILWENDQRPECLLILGPKWPMGSNTDVKQLKTFSENDLSPEFDLFWGPKRPQNWASGAHIPHTSKSVCNVQVEQYYWKPIKTCVHISESNFNTHIKQEWCKYRGDFLTKYLKTCILTQFESPKYMPLVRIFYTHTKIAPMSL